MRKINSSLYGVHGRFLNTLKSFYDNSVCVKVTGVGERSEEHVGVPPGCVVIMVV